MTGRRAIIDVARRRDSRLDPSRSIAEQFDLLRVADPQRFPAFFDLRGHRYLVRLKKLELPMSETIMIAGRAIGRPHQPFVIAEMSGNHNQSLDRALAIVDAAARSGAHALKFQTYTADTMTLDLDEGEFFDRRSGQPVGRAASLHELYQEAHTPWEWHAPIFERARGARHDPRSARRSTQSPSTFSRSSACPATRSRRSRTPTCR